jgi:hypothetical protein
MDGMEKEPAEIAGFVAQSRGGCGKVNVWLFLSLAGGRER